MRRSAFSVVFACTLAGCATVPAPAATPAYAPVVFEAPAGNRIAGPTRRGALFDRVLRSGRIIHPAGTNVVVGMNALGEALTPDGRFVIVSNDDERRSDAVDPYGGVTTGGYSLAVVDTRSMRVVDRYRAVQETFFAGVAALADPANPANTLVLASGGASNAVYAFDLDPSGHLRPDARPSIAIPGRADAQLANGTSSFPGTIVLSPSGAQAYVVNTCSNDVVRIDTATRTLAGTPVEVGYFPFGAAYSRAGLLIANEGLLQYGRLAVATATPAFATPEADLLRASSVSNVALGADGTLRGVTASVALDRGPDGVRDVGGTHPAAVVALTSAPYAFVALSNVDRIATISLAGTEPRAVGGTELRLYDRGPYGTQPVALALSPDERRLYVALAGIDAIAVLDVHDPVHPHRVGLIPTGSYPSALAASHDGRFLYVTNTKGAAIDMDDWSTLERIDLRATRFASTTPLALESLRAIRPATLNRVVPQTFGSSGSGVIKHVVFVLEDDQTYDAMLGDLRDSYGRPHGPGDPALTAFAANVTPNLHALARDFGVAGNFYADARDANAGHQLATAGIASAYTERNLLVRTGLAVPGANQDPEDYPRAGYVFNALARRGLTYRDYGELLRVSGYEDRGDGAQTTSGLGGVYAFDVPAPLSLSGHVDLDYPGWNPRIRDTARADEFVRDFDALVRADAMPAFTYIWLPDERTAAAPNVPAAPEGVADADRALGTIVDYLSHTPQWRSTAIFISADDARSNRDHIDARRSFAIVVSPYAKRGFVGMRHLSTASILKTEEELLGLPALSLGDALATDLSDFFSAAAVEAPFTRLDAPAQSAAPTSL